MRDKKFEAICEKLGFNPQTYKSDYMPVTEDDNEPSLVSALSVEEIDYLYENGYLYSIA